jgi:hypothetical protein
MYVMYVSYRIRFAPWGMKDLSPSGIVLRLFRAERAINSNPSGIRITSISYAKDNKRREASPLPAT